jgi:hypothetical protein
MSTNCLADISYQHFTKGRSKRANSKTITRRKLPGGAETKEY